MSLLRFAARGLLAGFFVADGVKAAVNPGPEVERAEPWAQAVAGWLQQILPGALADRVPTNTETLVRIHGATQAIGALMMATGAFRRTGALVLAAAYAPKVAMAYRSGGADKLDFLRELALLGGALVEAGDTQGKPSRAWRARNLQRYHLRSHVPPAPPAEAR